MIITPPDDPYYRAALAVARRLTRAGYETYFAGGAVRDAIMGNGAQDWDIATAATPDEVEELFDTTFPVGKEFGVVIVLESGFPFEVATFRSDGAYVDGRRPDGVVFTTPRQDVERRDFTINGLLLAPETGEVVDYVGGVTDLRNRIIRAIGNPRARFTEDKLRMLRAVRFAARFDLTWDPATEQALMEMARQITVVSRERIRNELQKMLTGPAPARALRDLWRLGMLEVLLPEVTALEGVEQNPLYHPEGDVLTHTFHLFDAAEVPLNPALAWAALLHDVGKKSTAVMRKGHNTFYEHEKVGADMAASILEELKASRALIHDVASLVRNHMKFSNVENMRVAKFKRLMAQELASTGVDFASFRFSNVYGPLQDWRGEGGVIAIFCARLAKGDAPTIYGDGSQTRDFIFVGDIVGAITAALRTGRSGLSQPVYAPDWDL